MLTDKSRRSPSGPVSQFKATADIAATVAGTAAVTLVTCTVSYARVGDIVLGNVMSGLVANVALGGCRVSATDVVTFELINPTAAKITTGTIDMLFEVFRSPMNGYLE